MGRYSGVGPPASQAFGLIEQVQRQLQVAQGRLEARLGNIPAMPRFLQRGDLTQFLAPQQVLGSSFQIVLFEVHFAQDHMQIGRSLRQRVALLRYKPQSLLARAQSITQPALRQPDVGQQEREAGGRADAAGHPRAGHAIGDGAMGRFQVSAAPARDPQQRRRRAAPKPVAGGQQVERLPGIAQRAGQVIQRPGAVGAGNGDRSRQRAKFLLVDDDHPLALPTRAANRRIGPGRRGWRLLRTGRRRLQPAFGVLQPRFGGVQLGRQQRKGVVDAEHGPGAHQLGRQRLHPALPQRLLAASTHHARLQLDQAGGSLEILGGQRVADGSGRQGVALVPRAGPAVQHRRAIRQLPQQARLQDLGEEVVIAHPLAAVVEGHDEQVAPLQRLQHGFAAFLPGDGIAQRAAQPVQDRGLQQEGAHAFRLAQKHLLHQVVQHEAVAAGEGAGRTRRCRCAPAWRARPVAGRRSSPRCGPPARPSRRGEVQPHHLVEELGRLVRGEAQVGGAQLGQLAAGAQAGQRQRRVLAAGDDQVQVAAAGFAAERPGPGPPPERRRRGSRPAPGGGGRAGPRGR